MIISSVSQSTVGLLVTNFPLYYLSILTANNFLNDRYNCKNIHDS